MTTTTCPATACDDDQDQNYDVRAEDRAIALEMDSDDERNLECGSCGRPCKSREWVPGYEFWAGPCCAPAAFADLAKEPPCTCQRTDVDLFDVADCEAHNPSSPWNVLQRAIPASERRIKIEGEEAA